MIAELDPAVMEPAVVLYLRIALPDWTVSWKGHKAIATHPDGSRAVWMYKYNGGDHAWISSLPDALLIAHPELGGYLLVAAVFLGLGPALAGGAMLPGGAMR